MISNQRLSAHVILHTLCNTSQISYADIGRRLVYIRWLPLTLTRPGIVFCLWRAPITRLDASVFSGQMGEFIPPMCFIDVFIPLRLRPDISFSPFLNIFGSVLVTMWEGWGGGGELRKKTVQHFFFLSNLIPFYINIAL